MLDACGIPVERLRGGEPILAPNGEGWESGHTYNAASVRLGREDRPLIGRLLGGEHLAPSDGAVAVFYRAQPVCSPGFREPRSSIGLALFTPELNLIRRFSHPILSPSDDPYGFDHNGVEDPRVTRLGDAFYLVYCGYTVLPNGAGKVRVCLARSQDLLHWEKLGPARGEVNTAPNKDGVLLPGRIEGQYLLMHRPMVGRPSHFSIELAAARCSARRRTRCAARRGWAPARCQSRWATSGFW